MLSYTPGVISCSVTDTAVDWLAASEPSSKVTTPPPLPPHCATVPTHRPSVARRAVPPLLLALAAFWVSVKVVAVGVVRTL